MINTLRPYQTKAIEKAKAAFADGKKRALVVLPTGCHAKGEKVMLSNGELIYVEDVKVGDKLMGEDGSSRTVLALHRGNDDLYKITPVKGNVFIVNSEHMLTLQKTPERKNPKYPCQVYNDDYFDISINDYLKLSKTQKHLLKLVTTKGVVFENEADSDSNITIDPYFLGLLIGDGYLSKHLSISTMDNEIVEEIKNQSKKYGFDLRTEPDGKAITYYFVNNKRGNKKENKKGKNILLEELKSLELLNKKSGNKFIPNCYKMASKENRLSLLAGLIDTDGSIVVGGYDYITKSKILAEDIAFVCRSLGLRVSIKKSIKRIKSSGFEGEYYRLSISGDTSVIPCRVKPNTPRKQIKGWNRTGFTVEKIGYGEYYGFTVDKDNRYLLPDFIITHNCGKTVLMSAMAENEVKNGGRVLFLAHRNKLLDQGAKEIEACTGIHAGWEMGNVHDGGEPILVSSVQTLSRDSRLAAYDKDEFSLIMIDEVHHMASSTYEKILAHFTGAKLLGVTATPVRGDKTDVSDLFEEVASEYTLAEAINDGWLSKIKVRTCPVTIDISGVGMQAGDYSVNEIDSSLKPYLDEIAKEIKAKATNRKIMVFVPLISTAKGMVDIFRNIGVSADYVAGERSDSEDVLLNYHNNRFQVLVSSLMLTEGYNEPAVDCVVNLRLTKSEALATQIIGRGTRLFPGKEDLLVLDFLWKDKNSRKKVSVRSIVAGDGEYADELEKFSVLEAAENVNADREIDIFELVDEAKRTVKQQREEALARALKDAADAKVKQEAYEAMLRKHFEELEKAKESADDGKIVKVNKNLSVVYDEFGMMYIVLVDDPVFKSFGIDEYYLEDVWATGDITEGQLKMIKNLGIPADLVACKGHASFIIDYFLDRRKAGLCSYKQAKFLIKKKIDVNRVSSKQASAAMGIISKNNWIPNQAFYNALSS